MIIHLDFDGTVVEHNYPQIGRYNQGCFEVLKKLQNAGHEIILNTYRADCNDGTLEKALNFINDNCKIFNFELKTLQAHTKKQYPDSFNIDDIKQKDEMYIDDQAYGTPLKNAVMNNSKMVDWNTLDKIFEANNIYKNN